MGYPPLHLSHLVKRLPVNKLPSGHRSWTGNDASQRNHNGPIPSGENPVFIKLHWKKDKNSKEKPVGGFEINITALEKEGYLSKDPAGGIRLKFIHGNDGYIYLGRGFNKKKIKIGQA